MYLTRLNQRMTHWLTFITLICITITPWQIANAVVDPNTTVQVILKNTFANTPLNGIKITAYERRADGSKQWRAHAHTDATGQATFNLAGLAEGRSYFFKTRPPTHTGYAYSADINTPGEVSISLGTLLVNVIDFSSQTALNNTKVTLYERLADDTKKWVATGYTDTNGSVRFAPTGLNSGRRYFAKTNPYQSGSINSADINVSQEVALTVGTLVATVRDYASQTPLSDKRVDLYQRLADGSKKWVAKGNTDTNGKIHFTPAGLAAGQTYLLKTKPFNTGAAYSQDIQSTGAVNFEVGTLTTTLIDDSTQLPLSNTLVHLYKRLPDAKKKWIAKGYTDADGMLRFTPLDISTNQAYLLKTKPYGTHSVYSDDITAKGAMTFKVGTLIATVLDHSNQTPVANTEVQLYQRLADGSKKWAAKGTTDSNGVIKFTPLKLGNGQNYFLQTNPYNTGNAYSHDINNVGNITLAVGTLKTTLLNAISQTPLPDTKVTLYERMRDGSKKWRAKGVTDANGIVRFSPFALGEGRSYLLQSKPYNTGYAYSDDINAVGETTFAVGTLEITLINSISQSPLANTKVSLYERLTGGGKKWRAKGNTDANGVLRFTPLGIGTTQRTYYLSTKPYNTGNVHSKDFTSPQQSIFAVGTLPVTLIDGDSNTPLANHKLTAYQKLASGKLQYRKSGTTDTQGTVHFDLPFGHNEVYIFRAKNIFGNNKKYFSTATQQPGKLSFIVTKAGDASLDTTSPSISISSPQNNANITANDVIVTGSANDNRAITRIILTVTNPDKGNNILPATYDASNNNWSAKIPATMLSLNQQITLTATAYDAAQNEQTTRISVTVVEDNTAPEITITSHTENQQIPVTGILLSGMVTDLTQVASLTASLQSTPLNSTSTSVLFNNQAINFSQEGAWTLALNNGSMTVGTTVTITLTATDSYNNIATKVINLEVIAVDYSDQHMINRITFGATPALIQEVASLGATNFLTQQLAPNTIDNSEFDAMIANTPLNNKKDLQAWTLLHMIYSKQQLLEVMTWFWDNHFNTDINTKRTNAEGTNLNDTVQYELNENQAFRSNALGNFADLLAISAKSPAMLIYLDSISNSTGDSNENYARELMELHTLGVNGGYSHADLEAVAEIFTGWHVHSQGGDFIFDANQHTEGMYTLLTNTAQSINIPLGGQDQGELFLAELAKHPSTANYICSKLITLFVSDTPPNTLLSSCAAEFLASSTANDQIKRVLTSILSSAEFNDSQYYRSKIKTPVEFIVGAVRNLEASTDAQDLISPLSAMGIRLYENSVPTGWSELGTDWISTNSLIERMKWINNYVRNTNSTDPLQFYPRYGYATADGIVGFLFQISLGDDYSDLSRNTAFNILGADFDLSSPNAITQLQRLQGTVLSYPQYQFQ